MLKVTMNEAEGNLEQLIKRALQGEDVIVMQGGKSLVRLVPVEESGLRPIGLNRQAVGEGFEERSLEPLDEEALKEWYKPDL